MLTAVHRHMRTCMRVHAYMCIRVRAHVHETYTCKKAHTCSCTCANGHIQTATCTCTHSTTQVVDYHDTMRQRWTRRAKARGGSGGGGVHTYGTPPLTGVPTLCDEIDGWASECKGSDASRCEVQVNQSTTCHDFCERHELWCEDAWDDAYGQSCRRAEHGRSAPMHVHMLRRRHMHMCMAYCSYRRAERGSRECEGML